MRKWTTASILEAIASFDNDNLPTDFLEIRTDEYRIIRYPERLLSPTLPAAQVVSSNISRSLTTVFDEISSIVRDWRLNEVHWWVTSKTHPIETENYLKGRGGVLSDSFQILARELDDQITPKNQSESKVIKLVCDEKSLRAAIQIETEGWGRSTPTEREIELRFLQALRLLNSLTEFQVIALFNDKPVATGCCTIKGDVARLFGGITLSGFRNRGFYQAVLNERLRIARDFGATVALTRGRSNTSGPLLIKSGFTVHANDNCYRMKISGVHS
jgi:hypothetical protein